MDIANKRYIDFAWIYQNNRYIHGYIHERYIQFQLDISDIYHFRCIHYGYMRSGYIHHVYIISAMDISHLMDI